MSGLHSKERKDNMIYTDLTRKAMSIAYNAHHGQVDKGDVPYVFHPVHLAEQANSEEACIVALLHDVVEDTNVTIEDLIESGFPEECIIAIKLLSHDKNQDYFEYIENLKTNRLARTVKLLDLNHNSDLSRLTHEPTEKDLKRLKKYHKSMQILQKQIELEVSL